MRRLAGTFIRVTCVFALTLFLRAQSASLVDHPDPASPGNPGAAAEVTADLEGAVAEFTARQAALFVSPRNEDLLEITGQSLNRAHELDPENPIWIAALARFERARAAASPDPGEKVAALRSANHLTELLSSEAPFGDWREQLRISILPDLSVAELEAGDRDSADRDAHAVLQLAAQEPGAWNHDDLVHTAETVLGRAALERGDVEEAKARLLASGKINGSGVLKSFGPSLRLAQELLAAGEADAVQQYLELCRAFWKNDRGRIDRYMELIRHDAAPNLLAPYALDRPSLEGSQAPSFKLNDIFGKEWTLAQLSGKTVIIDFWTTWCRQCQEELPVLETLADEFRDRGFVMLAVDVGEDEAAVRGFVAKHGMNLPVLLAGEDAMILAYQLEAYPTLVVIDPAGRVAKVHIGIGSEAELKELIDE